MAAVVPSYKGYRYPVEIISHCVWLYHRFPLSLREVEEMMMARGIVVSYETIRAGATRSVRPTRTDCAADGTSQATRGISTSASRGAVVAG